MKPSFVSIATPAKHGLFGGMSLINQSGTGELTVFVKGLMEDARTGCR